MSAPVIELEVHRSRLTLAPAMGGAVLGLVLDGMPVLRDARTARTVLDTAAFPLFPYCGRINQGRFKFDGTRVALAANFPPEPHAIHGECWQKPWSVSAQGETSLTLERTHDGTNWPWAYLSRQHFALSETTLTLDMMLANLSDRPMPAGFGWHPYFDADGAVLTGNTAAIWAAAPGAIGARPVPPSPDTDLSGPRPVSTLAVDNAYDWPARTAQIDWPARGLSLALTASDCFGHFVAYTPPGEPYFCIEPLSHAPDAVNLELAAVQSGLQRLAPGETLHGTITLARL